ncbi:MAG: AbgT family transporter [Solirubrobacterales bacterium]|nr:AbgT family transporter [Solirubrobacterales bacterium]
MSTAAATDPEDAPPARSFYERMLDGIERAGNRVPHPAMIFVGLIVIVIVASQIMHWAGVSSTTEVAKPPAEQVQERQDGGSQYPSYDIPGEHQPPTSYQIHKETIKAQGLLTGSGVRFIFTSFTKNFQEFVALTLILVVMIGVGLSEEAGLIGALVRKLVAVSPPATLAFVIVLIGVLSSIASDAGYLVLIPLGAAAFMSIGRHPLAGIAAGFAGVSAGFGVNFLITPTDAVLTEIGNDAIHLVDPHRSIDLTHNLWFGIGSTIMLSLLGAFITARIVERRLGRYDRAAAGTGPADPVEDAPVVAPADEARGLRFALLGFLAVVVVIALLTAIPGAPLRNPETGSVIGDSPFMESLVFMISLVFFVAGYAFGRGAGTIKTSTDVINAIVKQWGTLVGLLFLFLLISQFLAYFNYSNIPALAAAGIGHALEGVHIPAIWLLILFIGIVTVVNLILSGAIPKWAIFAPIFIPVFLKLNVNPATVVAAYRIGDSPTNVITPAMAYLPLVVVFCQRYQKDAGLGTVISLMLPYAVIFAVVWTLFFVVWYLIGIPFGPGAGVHL